MSFSKSTNAVPQQSSTPVVESEQMNVDAVLSFWFEDSLEATADLDAHVSRWFAANPAYDRLIELRFGAAIELARSGQLDEWLSTSRGQLAQIILLDQLPRNVFRGKPGAYASDEQSRQVCRAGLASGADQSLALVERNFFYMPLLHSENIGDQQLSVACFDRLLSDAGEHQRPHFVSCASAARRYRDLIARFGRFPHRNVIFRRQSTPVEISLLEGGGN